MFNTIKSKILGIVFAMLVVLSIVLSTFTYFYLKNSKSLMMQKCSFVIGEFVQNINKDIIRIENNAKDLALMGEFHYQSSSQRELFEFGTKKVFENYPKSLGGGIWFKPEVFGKLSCIYAFRNRKQEILIDERYETPEYNYPNQNWYKEIISKLSKEDNVKWSLPYYEKEGGNTFMVTAGSGMYSKGKLIGISTVDWELSSIINSIRKMRPTPNSFALFADEKNDYVIATTDPYLQNLEIMGKSLKDIPWYNNNLRKITYITYHDKKYIPYVKALDNNMILIICVPKGELFCLLILQVVILFSVLILVSIAISILLYFGLNNNITKPINVLVEAANKISAGDLNTKIEINKPEEFENLASTFNKMTKDIETITKQREKIESEMTLAKQIQASSLPNIFPPYPDRNEFDIFASMNPALNVGGDFYDFYFLDENRIMFLIADVSGKGVPAALFMMIVKTIVKGVFQSVDDLKFAIKYINNRVCLNNKYNLFVTMLSGVVDLKNEKLTLINCGHNPPLIKRSNGEYEYINVDSNIVLGAIKDVDFEIKELDFNAGDKIFIYTDGVTEAMDSNGNLYSEKKLKETLNSNKNLPLKETCEKVKEDIDNFSHDVEQTDDITMLALEYFGNNNTYKNIASKENYKYFSTWLNKSFEKLNIDPETRQKIELSFEEIYTNIFSYAYPPFEGEAEVSLAKEEEGIVLQLKDWGVPYNPLEKQDPDINLSADERPIGGLGIFMVKQMSKSIEYKYENSNILTIKF